MAGFINPKTGLCTPGGKENRKFVPSITPEQNRVQMELLPPFGEICCDKLAEGRCLVSGFACLPENRRVEIIP